MKVYFSSVSFSQIYFIFLVPILIHLKSKMLKTRSILPETRSSSPKIKLQYIVSFLVSKSSVGLVIATSKITLHPQRLLHSNWNKWSARQHRGYKREAFLQHLCLHMQRLFSGLSSLLLPEEPQGDQPGYTQKRGKEGQAAKHWVTSHSTSKVPDFLHL